MSDYPNIPELPDPPLRSDGRVDFARKGSVFLGFFPAMRDAFNAAGAWVESTAATIFGYKQDAEQARDDAGQYASDASDQVSLAQQQVSDAAEQVMLASQQVSLAAEQVDLAAGQVIAAQEAAELARSSANFKGEWADLSGAMAMPATVRHSNMYWTLLRDIANVATSQPGVSGDWAPLDTYSISWQPVSANTTMVAGRSYAVTFTGGPLTLTLPANPSKDDLVQIYVSAGSPIGSTIARNGKTIMGQAQNMTIDAGITRLSLVFNGTDWRVL